MSISLEKLRAVKTIITHENCADGVVSAMFLHEALPEAEIKFVQYGNGQLEIKPVPNMLFCDFSPHPDKVQEFVDVGAIVLDHHKTSKDVVAAFGEDGVFGDEIKNPGVCGATLAFREVWSPIFSSRALFYTELATEVAELTGIRDTWLNNNAKWEKACALAEIVRPTTSVFSAESWLNLQNPFDVKNQQWWNERIEIGQHLIRKTNQSVLKSLSKAHRFTSSKGTKVVLFSGIKLSSDAAESDGGAADLVVGFDYVGVENGSATLVFSTRSKNDFDCSEFCKKFGGGGHTKAAGFSIQFSTVDISQDPYSLFRTYLEKYEIG